MKKLKKSFLFLLVGLVLFAPVVGLFPVSQGTAYAEAGKGPTTADEEVRAYVYSWAFKFCLANADQPHGQHNDIVEPNNASDFEWFERVGVGMGYVAKTSSGANLPGYGAKDIATCNDTEWVRSAMEMFQLGGHTYGTDSICYAGFDRQDKQGQADEDCVLDTGNYQYPDHGSRGKGTIYFVRNVTKYYYGKEADSLPELTAPGLYWLTYQNFHEKCSPIERGTLGEEYDQAKVDANPNLLVLTEPDGTQKVYEVSDDNLNKEIPVAMRNSTLLNPTCKSLADQANQWSDKYIAYVKDHPEYAGTPSGSVGVDGDESGVDLSCNFLSFNPLNWIICPLVNSFETIMNKVENFVTGMLCVDEATIFGGSTLTCSDSPGQDNSRAFYAAWSAFRVLALSMIAIAGLIMIFSQALSFDFIDAYTIKKVLPRLLIAGILITLSWPLMEFVVTLSNALGVGVRTIIYTPFNNAGINHTVLGGGTEALGLLFAGGGLIILGPLGLLSFLLTGLLALFVAFFVLVIRNILVIFLIIVAPLAISMYVLPNTEKYAKLWWDWFFKALMAFPIITGMIAIGHVFAGITTQAGGNLSSIVAFVAYFAPYFLIPAAFRFAGGALATIGGFTNDRSRGAFDRLSKFRKGQSEKRMAYFGQKYGDRFQQARAERIRGLDDAASENAASGNKVRAFAQRRLSGAIGPLGGIEPVMSAINARTAKHMNDTIATGNDAEIRGLTVDRSMGFEAASRAGVDLARDHTLRDADGNALLDKDGNERKVRQWKSLGGAWINEADVIKGHKEWGRDVGAQQAALSYEMRKAMTDEEVAGISSRYGSLATQQWGMTETQAGGAWIGAGFENQNQHLEFKNTNWENGQLDAAKFSKEAYEKKGSYQLSQMSAHTIKQLKQAYNVADGFNPDGSTPSAGRGATDEATKQRIQAVAETFMQRGGGGRGGVVNVGEDGTPQMAPAGPIAPTVALSARDEQMLAMPPQIQQALPQADQARLQQIQLRQQQARQSGQGDYYQSGSQGSGHVAEAVRDLAVHVGVYRPLDPSTDIHSAGGPSSNPRQG